MYRVCLNHSPSPCIYRCVLQRLRTCLWDLDPIRIRVHCESNTLATWRPILRMIRRSVQICAMKTRRRLGFKTRHFMWVFVYWSILILTFYLIISCECIYDFYIILVMPATAIIPWCSGTVLLIYHLLYYQHCYRFVLVFWVNEY